jgi:hypothetical protein
MSVIETVKNQNGGWGVLVRRVPLAMVVQIDVGTSRRPIGLAAAMEIMARKNAKGPAETIITAKPGRKRVK